MKMEHFIMQDSGACLPTANITRTIATDGASGDHSNEDDFLIQHILDGDIEAFGRLVEKYQNHLFDLACRILGNRMDAEDILQDSFIAAYRHLSSFNHRACFSTWLYSIVLNRIRNHLRHAKVLKCSSLDTCIATEDGGRPLDLPEPGARTETLVESHLELEAIKREVNRLPIHYQSMFIMHYFQDMPVEKVAKRLNRPTGTVKVYLHRARKLLYQRLVVDASHEPSGTAIDAGAQPVEVP